MQPTVHYQTVQQYCLSRVAQKKVARATQTAAFENQSRNIIHYENHLKESI